MKDLFKRLWAWLVWLFTPQYIEPVKPPIEVRKTALLFGINDYPGTLNDLNGCVNDVNDVSEKLLRLFPEFTVKIFIDASVTIATFVAELTQAVLDLSKDDTLYVHLSSHGTQLYDQDQDEGDGYDEALYLYDGPLRDDDIGHILDQIPEGAKVILVFDTCFSGTVTKKAGTDKIRFRQMSTLPIRHTIKKALVKSSLKYIVISACKDYQVSMDAYFGDRYNGAFTYYWVKSLFKGFTYNEIIARVGDLLYDSGFEQIPTIEGPEEMMNSKIFE